MPKRKQGRGDCVFCGRSLTKGGLTRHLPVCSKREDAIKQANQEKEGQPQPIYHIQARDGWGGDFWLHLEMNGQASLKDLDNYLRAIWLECCGHLSQFSIGGWRGDEIPMSRKARQVFDSDVELTHLYDFGTTSETLIKTIDVRQGQPLSNHPIYLMGRNDPPDLTCMECDKQAVWFCLECAYELEEPGFLCDEHVEDHPHEAYGEPMPVVNSPRMGMCGYDGPAQPPY